ncbi:RDD family protein [Streptomyces sp. NBC_00503]|uniref:RDD family protein n=1 Tax=Streptomyces sp. NBC_00503 TaxID=2903659 RepID=UPI002E80EE11|nr:RDD family protein [Streptomyces sp. NBC_00503]WUD79427.1 RDD family protein [Streptomyces sp. NBC_00503]
MSFGDPNNPYGQQPPQGQPGYPPQGQPGYPQQAPQGVPQQYGYPQQQPPMGMPPQQPYGAYPPAGAPGMPGAGMPPLAHWGLRAAALILDVLIIAGPMILASLLTGGDENPAAFLVILSLVAMLYAIGMAIFQLYKEGSTGQTIGKGVVGISLRRESDGAVLGFGMAFVRRLAHILDSAACYIGWLFPLWDVKKQTFADKVCATVVVVVPKG